MSSSLTFQDDQTGPLRPHQEPNVLSQETSSDQRCTQNPNQEQNRNQDSEERGAGVHPNYSPDPPDEQQHPSPNRKSMSTSDLDLNLSYIQDDCLIIKCMIGTPEGQIPNIKDLDNEALLPDLSYFCGSNHFNPNNKRVQSLLRHQRE